MNTKSAVFECKRQMRVISVVDQPTEWCAPIVVMLKQNGRVQLGVDLNNSNESILGRYCFNRLPYGISTSSEQFQILTRSKP